MGAIGTGLLFITAFWLVIDNPMWLRRRETALNLLSSLLLFASVFVAIMGLRHAQSSSDRQSQIALRALQDARRESRVERDRRFQEQQQAIRPILTVEVEAGQLSSDYPSFILSTPILYTYLPAIQALARDQGGVYFATLRIRNWGPGHATRVVPLWMVTSDLLPKVTITPTAPQFSLVVGGDYYLYLWIGAVDLLELPIPWVDQQTGELGEREIGSLYLVTADVDGYPITYQFDLFVTFIRPFLRAAISLTERSSASNWTDDVVRAFKSENEDTIRRAREGTHRHGT